MFLFVDFVPFSTLCFFSFPGVWWQRMRWWRKLNKWNQALPLCSFPPCVSFHTKMFLFEDMWLCVWYMFNENKITMFLFHPVYLVSVQGIVVWLFFPCHFFAYVAPHLMCTKSPSPDYVSLWTYLFLFPHCVAFVSIFMYQRREQMECIRSGVMRAGRGFDYFTFGRWI
jgi:hypothetical protein